ncbi:MAG: 50S ribosome-binding GTPase [Candidatus Omnitrophica bacterium]|nr:50S ribosome-binding GTPase [Candidatus Omnitrophota bacterium]
MENQTCSPTPACRSCPSANLVKLGEENQNFDYMIALAGNPNTGKSTVFNALTGLRQHTGNWPGKTVTRAEGGFSFDGRQYKIVDLPGTYSLLSASPDEEVARDFILFGHPNVTVIVADATRLERNLNLVLQVLEITDKAVFCVNLIDEARRHGISIDAAKLEERLGIPVILTAARQRKGIHELLQAISDVASGQRVCRPYRLQNEPPELKEAIHHLVEKIERLFPGLPNARWVALRVLEGDKRMISAIQSGELRQLYNIPEIAGAGQTT